MPRDNGIPADQATWLVEHGFKETGCGEWTMKLPLKWNVRLCVKSGFLHDVAASLYISRELIIETDADTVQTALRQLYEYFATRFGSEFFWELWWSPSAISLLGEEYVKAHTVSSVCKSMWEKTNDKDTGGA